ncbi:MAG TPA: hypothetical protein VJX10_14085, partial [Pseudonocardiaceae bacterium]|nr:hypothetical protein [Pseudonocardiaceae bacterium]
MIGRQKSIHRHIQTGRGHVRHGDDAIRPPDKNHSQLNRRPTRRELNRRPPTETVPDTTTART